MPYSIAKQEHGCGADRSSLEGQIPPKGEAGRNADRQVSHANLELEGSSASRYRPLPPPEKRRGSRLPKAL
jgi:hypothetical protein